MGWGYWVSYLWRTQLSFQIFKNLENGRASREVPQERQGDPGQRGEKDLLGSLGGLWRGDPIEVGPHLQSAPLLPGSHCPSEKQVEKLKSTYTSKEGSRVAVVPWAPCPSALVWCLILHVPYSCCARCRHPAAGTSSCLWRGVRRQQQGFTAYFSQTVTLWSWGTSNCEQQDTSLMLNKSSSAALEPSQGGRSHLIRPKQLTATLPWIFPLRSLVLSVWIVNDISMMGNKHASSCCSGRTGQQDQLIGQGKNGGLLPRFPG